jgi:hypothetical protein
VFGSMVVVVFQSVFNSKIIFFKKIIFDISISK